MVRQMMSPRALRQVNTEAAQRAAEMNKQPMLVEDPESITGIPNLGHYESVDHELEGWERVNLEQDGWPTHRAGVFEHNLFVDNSGFGGPNEPALNLTQLVDLIREHGLGYGYAIVESGQFQVKVGVFRRV